MVSNARSVPSASAVFRYLAAFHDSDEDANRVACKAYIPAASEPLRGLAQVNKAIAAYVQKRHPQRVATLDQDATLVATTKHDALFSYKGFKSYQPLNTWWSEQQMVLHTEFRDGNVPAGYEQKRALQESLSLLPEGVEQIRLRSDTAGYQHSLLRYCDQGEDRRFGRIEFAVGADVTPEFKKAVATELGDTDWKPIYKDLAGVRMKTNQEWAEVCFIPNALGCSKHAPVYRYIAIREPMGSAALPGLAQQQLPFQTLQIELQAYKLFALVSNMDWEGEKLIHWHRERCGKSEEAHSVMKGDFAGGKLPSGDFGENAAWWWIMILAMNINAVMKQLVLGGPWRSRRMKAIRFSFINIAGRIVKRSRALILRLANNDPAVSLLIAARRRILELSMAPSG